MFSQSQLIQAKDSEIKDFNMSLSLDANTMVIQKHIYEMDNKNGKFKEKQKQGIVDALETSIFSDKQKDLIDSYVSLSRGSFFLLEKKKEGMKLGGTLKLIRLKKHQDVEQLEKSVLLQAYRKEIMQVIDNHLIFSKFELQKLIGYLKSQNKQESMTMIHSVVNILYYCVVTRHDDLLTESLTEFGYREDLYPIGMDPLFLAMKINNNSTLEIFTKYFYSEESNKVFNLTPEVLLEGLKCSSMEFKAFLIDSFFVEGQDILSFPQYLPGDEQMHYALSSPVYHREGYFYRKLMEEAHGTWSSKTKVKVKYLTTSFRFNVSLGSEFTYKLLLALEDNDDRVIQSNLKGILKYYWEKAQFYIKVFSFCYWAFALCIFINTIWCRNEQMCTQFFFDNEFLGRNVLIFSRIFNLVFWVILVFYEVMMLPLRYKNYIFILSNWLDVIAYVFFWMIRGHYMRPIEGNIVEDGPNFWISFYLLLVSMRCVFHLKVVDGIRYLVSMLGRVFVDMKFFIILLLTAILAFSAIETQLSKSISPSEDSFFNPEFNFFLKKINGIYNIGYGNWEDSSTYTANFYFFYLLETLLVPLVMFNLLIAIISETFADFQENKTLIDYRELIGILADFSCFNYNFYKLTCYTRWRRIARKHIHLAIPEETDKTGKKL